MAKILQICGAFETLNAGVAVTYFPCANSEMFSNTVEANSQITYRTAGTLSNLYVRVSSNSLTAATTIGTRVNGINGNQSVSFASSTTGSAEDTTNTDAISAGDEVNYSVAVGATGTSISFRVIQTLFAASANTVIKHAAHGTVNITTASQTLFGILAGWLRISSTEAFAQFNVNSVGTLKNLFVYVSANARTTTTTFGTRINGVSGNLTVSIAGGSTGIFEDTANSDTLAVNDNVNYFNTTGTGTETLTLKTISVEEETTNNKFHSTGGKPDGTSFNPNIAHKSPIGGDLTTSTVESANQSELNITATLSNLFIYISANSITATSTFDLRDDGASTALTLSIGASTTGAFEDTANSVSLVATDLVNFRLATGATGTSMVARVVGCMLENTEAGGGAPATTANKHTLLMMGV